MRSIVTFAAAALMAGMIVPRYAAQLDAHHATPTADAHPAAATEAAASGPTSVEVARDGLGRFRIDGRVEGRSLEFIVDTGATVIALTADDAASLGIHPAVGDYTVLMRTASGTIRAAPTTLDMVEIGDIMVRDVPAVVMPDGALSDNLLGMSFLSRLRHFDYREGKMVLEQ
jgi:aspartyl protease family protein